MMEFLQWIEQLPFSTWVREGGDIYGYGSLHLSNAPWSKHVGELRVLINSEQRGKGLQIFPSDAHQLIQPRQQLASVSELDLQYSSPNDAHAGGQGSVPPRFGCNRQLDLPASPVPAHSFQVLCQPNPAPDLIGKRLASLHPLESRDQILAPNQKRAAGLVAAKLVQQADGGAPADLQHFF